MDDEEEIDIINFDDISKISSGQLLSCDYTVHPKWVNENAEGGNFWSDSVPKHENLENNVEVLHSEEVVIEEPETKLNILDLGWAGEIAMNDDVVFEEDIPATVEEIVTNGEEYQEQQSQFESPSSDIQYQQATEYHWDEPAAFETHPASKHIKLIGPTNSRSLLKVKIETRPSTFTANPRSLLKSNNPIIHKPFRKFKQTLTVSSNIFEKRAMPSKKRDKFKAIKVIKIAQPKFKQSIKLQQTNFHKERIETLENKIKAKTKTKIKSSKINASASTSQSLLKKNNPKMVKKPKKSVIHFGENITISHEIETQKNSEPIIFAHNVVKLDNNNDFSDIEIDVEGETDVNMQKNTTLNLPNPKRIHLQAPLHSRPEITKLSSSSDDENFPEQLHKSTQNLSPNEIPRNFTEISEELSLQLSDLTIPQKELKIDPEHISDLEKYILSEFFEGRITKTPEQYLRIRNHILSTWYSIGKYNYVSKTAVRGGLKHGGDVNCISRIHRLLEQIGAINFGFQGKYFEFVRPLEEYMSMFIQTTRTNPNVTSTFSSQLYGPMERRNRTKQLSISDESNYDKINSKYTIHHSGYISKSKAGALPLNDQMNTTKVLRKRHIRNELDLVHCLKYSKDNLAPFKASITLSTLLCIQFHSLSNLNERMGFIGGHRSKAVGRNKLSLTRYKPCRTSQQSGTMCEMCPVSQVEQSTILKAEGHELLGWFHSHPLFPANPSRTDVRTQQEMQLQFSMHKDRPFVGVIFSCLNMTFKCMYVMPKDLHSDINEGVCLPYELDVDIIKDCTNFNHDIQDVIEGIKNDENVIDMAELINKFKTSTKTILQQFGYNSLTFFNQPFWK